MNKLIVESKNDKYFVEALINALNLNELEVDEPLCNVDEYICLDGIDNLKHKLKDLKLDNIDRLGIILDADEVGVLKRIEQINKVLKELNINIELEKINEFRKDKNLDISIACHILNIDGKGELENILKQIAKNDTVFADCLESWKKCLEDNDKGMSQKDFLKFWVNNYIRFDTCTKEEQKQIGKKCSFQSAMQKDIWDFEHSVLDSLKKFLQSMKNNEIGNKQ
ncbi:DUF3226 domain-containing protein [Sulfurimonas crateris]|uniref:DUF3226 domain-containing protein n=1 Tax=Sulfurimonas crateris TaxID=2574727 RepID=UPI001CB753E1|nr:DUF3226 domain-containing protein [Sulfurimonas crateris]